MFGGLQAILVLVHGTGLACQAPKLLMRALQSARLSRTVTTGTDIQLQLPFTEIAREL